MQPAKIVTSAPPGLAWLWRLAFGHGFWIGLGVALCMTPLAMMAISFAWTGHWPSWDEHFKSFIVGDQLLAVVIGILALLASRPSALDFRPSQGYWTRWLCAGFAGSALYIAGDVVKGKLEFVQVLEPHLFYHHVLLVATYVAMIGMLYMQYRRHPHSRLWLAVVLLLAGYFGLIVYDTLYPPAWFREV